MPWIKQHPTYVVNKRTHQCPVNSNRIIKSFVYYIQIPAETLQHNTSLLLLFSSLPYLNSLLWNSKCKPSYTVISLFLLSVWWPDSHFGTSIQSKSRNIWRNQARFLNLHFISALIFTVGFGSFTSKTWGTENIIVFFFELRIFILQHLSLPISVWCIVSNEWIIEKLSASFLPLICTWGNWDFRYSHHCHWPW